METDCASLEKEYGGNAQCSIRVHQGTNGISALIVSATHIYAYTCNVQSSGAAIPSFVASNLSDDVDPQREVLIKDTAASIYAGGYLVLLTRIHIDKLSMTGAADTVRSQTWPPSHIY